MKGGDESPFLRDSRGTVDTAEHALELFGAETKTDKPSNAVRTPAPVAIATVRGYSWIGVIVVAVISVVASFFLINSLLPAVAPSSSPAASAESATATSDNAQSTRATVSEARPIRSAAASEAKPVRSAAVDAAATRRQREVVVTGEQVASPRRETGPLTTLNAATVVPQADRPNASVPLRTEIAPPAVAFSSEALSSVIDETIYSAQDRDVLPPQTSENLPGPTISSWTTRTNAMEVIVSEAGAVERVRLVTPPQRMPDMFVLSRAKMWKFTPAIKDGRPVRYRLVLTWEVNP
jgi:hypothetical protein